MSKRSVLVIEGKIRNAPSSSKSRKQMIETIMQYREKVFDVVISKSLYNV